MNNIIEELLQRGYDEDTISSYIKYKYKDKHLVYDTKVSTNVKSKFIVCESDSLSHIMNKFIRKISSVYSENIVYVEKNYHKLIDTLNHITVKVLESHENATVRDSTAL